MTNDDIKEEAGDVKDLEKHIVNVKELTEEDKIGIDIDDSDLKEYDKDLKATINDSERLLSLQAKIRSKPKDKSGAQNNPQSSRNKFLIQDEEFVGNYRKRVRNSSEFKSGSADVISGLSQTSSVYANTIKDTHKRLTEAQNKLGMAVSILPQGMQRTSSMSEEAKEKLYKEIADLEALEKRLVRDKEDIDLLLKDAKKNTPQIKRSEGAQKPTQQTKQSTSTQKQINPLAQELSQLADNARQAANETIGKSSAELQQIVADFNKQFNDIRSKEGYQADSKETKSAQAAISKLVTATEKRRKEELSETRSTRNEAKLKEDWEKLNQNVNALKNAETLRSEAAGKDGKTDENKLAELIKTESTRAKLLSQDVKKYDKVATSDERADVISAIQSRQNSYKELSQSLSEAAKENLNIGDTDSENTNIGDETAAAKTSEEVLNDAIIEAKRFISSTRAARAEIENTATRSKFTAFNEEALAGLKEITDKYKTGIKNASDSTDEIKGTEIDDIQIAPELLDVTNTFVRETNEKLNQATKGLVKDYFTKEFDGDLQKVIDALGNPEAVKELGINKEHEQIANALRNAQPGSSLGDAVSSALDAAQAEKKKVADKERQDAENIRKIWKDTAKADVITAKSNVDTASTTEEGEAALKEYIKQYEIYAELLKQFISDGSEITNDSEIAKAEADIKKAKADLDESLKGVSKEAKEYIKSIEDQVKAITSDKSLSADEKAFKIQNLKANIGYTARNDEEAKAVAEEYGNIDKLTSDLMHASQAEDGLKQKALDVAAANRKIAEADTTDKQIAEHRNLAGIYRQQASATTDAAEREKLLTQATNEEAKAQAILDRELAQARQIAKDAQQAFMQIVDMVNSATNKVIGLIRSSIGLANRGVNATVNGGKKIVSTLGRVVQLFGSLSNRVRSCIATVINFARSTTQALGRVLNGVRSLIAHFNIFNRQAAGKNGLSLAFTELNSAISLAERAFNGLFNNQLLAKSIKFDSTIASITMLLGGEATDDTQRFASALQDAFGISYSQTISDLQEITSLLKAAGLEASGLTGTGIANAAQDLYAISQYFGALGMAGGSAAEVMSKLESGMKGMTQSIDDLGLSVRENDMNEFLKDKEYNIKFSDLSEANKETVRLAAIIEQFKNNFNIEDYTKLLDQSYYKISMIKSQITEIGTIIGKIFQGIIGKYLPYILGALNFVRTQLEGLAGKLGIDLSGDEVQKSLEGVKDTVDGITDSEKDAAKAAKDYTNTAGFDEITSLNSGSSDQDMNLSNLLTDVGSISDKLQGIGAEQKSLVDELKAKWSEFVKDTLGKDADPFFGFNKGKAKKSLGNIGKNIQRWWKSFKETTLTLSLKFADDLQAGRFANDVLRLVDAITKLVAIIQEQLSPVVQDFYDKHLSKYVKEFGDKFNEFSKTLKKRVNQLDKDLKGGMTFGDAWKKNFGSILPPDLQARLEKIVKIVKTLYKEYITPIKDAVLTTFDTMGTLSMGGLNIVESTITKGEEGESLLDKVLGNYQTFSKDKLQPWIESTTNSIASYIETHKTEIANLIDQIANDLFDVFTLLADIVGKLITWNIENPEMLNTIAETAKKVLGFVSDNFDTIMRIVELFVQLISASIDGLLSGIQIIFDKIAELDTVKPGEDKSQLQNIIDNVCKFIKAIWEDLGTGISNLLQWVSDNEGALTGALIVIEGLTSFFSNHVVGLLNAIIAIKTVTGIASVTANLIKFAGAIKTVGSALGLMSGAGSAATAAKGAAAAAGSTASTAAAAAAGTAGAQIVGKAATAAIEASATGATTALATVESAATGAIGAVEASAAGTEAAALTTIEAAGSATFMTTVAAGAAAALAGGYVGAKIGQAIDKKYGLTDYRAAEKVKDDNAKAAERLKEIADNLQSTDAATREQAQALLEKEFRLKPEDLDPFMKQVEGSSAKQLDMSQLTVDSLGNVTTEMADGRTVMVAALQDIIAEDAKIAEDQKSLLERIYDRIPTDAYQGMKGLQFKEDTGGYYQALQYSKRPIKIRALGGSVPSGQLFIANEAGNPELIGQIGKKTGADVANRGMITDAMETAVYNGLVDALNQSRQQATTGMSTPTTINVNGFGLIDKNALRQFAKILAPYLSANKDSFITA